MWKLGYTPKKENAEVMGPASCPGAFLGLNLGVGTRFLPRDPNPWVKQAKGPSPSKAGGGLGGQQRGAVSQAYCGWRGTASSVPNDK